MARAGAQRIPETEQADPLVLSHDVVDPRRSRGARLRGRREVLLLKKSFDVFTNPNAEVVLDVLDPSEVILFGVATDVCDHMAVMGLLRRGRRVAFVEDAARGLDAARTAACLAQWRDAGVRFTTTAEVVVARTEAPAPSISAGRAGLTWLATAPILSRWSPGPIPWTTSAAS